MAINVPIYEKRVQSVAMPGYRQNIHDPTNDALAGVGEGITKAATGFGEVAKSVKDEQDTAAQMDAYKKLAETKQALLDDPDNGFLAQKGKAAVANSKSFLENFKSASDGIRAGLVNNDQRRAFDSLAVKESLSFVDSVDHHIAGQVDAVKQQAYAGAIDAAKSDAAGAAARGDYAQIGGAIHMANQAVDAIAMHEGWDSTYAAQQKKAVATDAHLGVLDSMMEQGRTSDAREYLSNVSKEMDGALLAKSNMEHRIAAATVRDDARAVSDNLWDAANGDPSKALQLLQAKGIKDTALFDEADRRIRQRGSAEIAARREADKPLLGQLEQKLYDPRVGSFNTTDPVYLALTDEGKGTAMRMLAAEQRAGREESNRERQMQNQTDRDALLDFLARDRLGSPGSDQRSTDVVHTYPDASKAGRDRIKAEQNKVIEQAAKDGGVSMSEFDKMVTEKIQGAGLSGRRERAATIKTFMENAYTDWLKDPKHEGARTIPPDVVKKMLGDAFLQGQRNDSAMSFLGDIGKPNMLQVEAQMKGYKWEAFAPGPATQPPAGSTVPAARAAEQSAAAIAAPPAQQPLDTGGPRRREPAPESQIIIVGPGGKKKAAPATAATDAWLKAHPEWKRQ